MKYEIRPDVRLEVADYLQSVGTSQAAIQRIGQQVRWFRLGRQACTRAERELVEVVYSADWVLKGELSATLKANRRKPEERTA